jgi:two-component system alkaline phosphatase synthesis response regulator PhoP
MNQPPLILVVDDEENFREIFSIKLNSLGWRVETAEDGRQAVQKAKNLKPDLILMDVRMPLMDGIEAATKLKEDAATKDIKIVFLTVLGEAGEDRQEIYKRLSKEIGVAGYIKKSDNLDVIIERVKQFLLKQP